MGGQASAGTPETLIAWDKAIKKVWAGIAAKNKDTAEAISILENFMNTKSR